VSVLVERINSGTKCHNLAWFGGSPLRPDREGGGHSDLPASASTIALPGQDRSGCSCALHVILAAIRRETTSGIRRLRSLVRPLPAVACARGKGSPSYPLPLVASSGHRHAPRPTQPTHLGAAPRPLGRRNRGRGPGRAALSRTGSDSDSQAWLGGRSELPGGRSLSRFSLAVEGTVGYPTDLDRDVRHFLPCR
jgi:hypothetical protein